MQAFATPTPLRLTQQQSSRCVTRRKPFLTLAEHPTTPRGRRVPAFKKLQRRHRRGPSSFRRTQTEREEEQDRSILEKKEVKKRPITGRPGTPLRELAVGQTLEGIVQNIVPHGAFVDVGATRDGLVHVRDMSIDFVHTPRDVVRSGMRVHVWVKYVDPVRDVLGLTMVKPVMGFEGRSKIGEIETGNRYHGVIERVTNYGAYIDIGAERLAFLHVSGVWGENPRETLEYMRLGDRVWVSVIGVDEKKGHIRLFARGKNNDRLTTDSELAELIEEEAAAVHVSPDVALARPWDEQEEAQAQEDDDTEDMEGSDEADEDEDEDEDEWDEFDFVNEDEEVGGNIHLQDLGEVAHMFTKDTEFVDMTFDD